MDSLEATLARISPRLNPPPSRPAGAAIWAAAVLLFIALFAQGFVRTGIAAWAVGVVYILYDTALLLFVARRTAPLAHPAARSPRSPVAATCAVVIAAWNEAPMIAATVAALRAQSTPPDLIVVADDGSDDATSAVMAGLPDVRWLRLPRGGKARALNAAIAAIETDLIVTVDADTLLDSGALAAMRGAFDADPALVAATGVLRPVCAPSRRGRLFEWFQTYEYIRNFLSRYAWMRADSLLLVSGAFAGFRRAALVAVGGFDPACLVEDYEVMHRLHRRSADLHLGWQVAVIGGAQARTDSPSALLPFLRQRRRWFAGFLQTQFWNRDMIGNNRYGALGRAMLPVKTLDTVQPLYGLAAFALLLGFLVMGGLGIARAVIYAMVVKIVIDLAWLLRSLVLYRRWTGRQGDFSAGGAVLAALIEPFSFQLLRHAGAAWGWWVFLTRRQVWGPARRGTFMAGADAGPHDRATDPGASS